MDQTDFEKLVELVCKRLQYEARQVGFSSSPDFETKVREVLHQEIETKGIDLTVDFDSHVQAFPDICLGEFGIEVKFTEKDTWRGVANSISQGMKDPNVKNVYVIWCKMGGTPEVRYRLYEEVVMHVRTSHVPRFEIDMTTDESLFDEFRLTYAEFTELEMPEKMRLVRSYARRRLSEGANIYFWWLEDQFVGEQDNAGVVELFDELSKTKRHALIAEEILLFPETLRVESAAHEFHYRVIYFWHRHRILYP